VVDPARFKAASISSRINWRRASKIIWARFVSISTAWGDWLESRAGMSKGGLFDV
jgi:hypothetical protein